jgi:isoamylase
MKNKEYSIPIRLKGNPLPLGTTVQVDGINFSISVPNKTKCILHIYNKETKEKIESYLLTKDDKIGNIFSIFLKNINKEQCIYRYETKENEFIDPYAKIIIGREIFGNYNKKREKEIYGALIGESSILKDDIKLNIPYHELMIYKLNVRGFTMDKSSNVREKGTFLGIREKIPYLKALGINCVMLMPCYDFDEIMLLNTYTSEYKVNVWGYSESNYYFAPKSSYGSRNADLELKSLIYELHQNNIEIVMDMYFVKGTNQTLIHNCIRYWVDEYHVDGFKLSGESIPLILLATDPILSETKIIGDGFPMEEIYQKNFNPTYKNLAEYNDGFSCDVKQFLRGDEEKAYSFTRRLIKNPNKCGVINYITNHDGFTLHDLYSYDVKHNEKNKEYNRDGTNYNYSTNCGTEGKTEDINVLNLRDKRIKNAFVSLFFSQGTPLLLSGDEFLQSMEGNNNCYCNDNELYYLDWDLEKKNESMISFVKALIKLRKEHKVLHKREAFTMMDYLSIGVPDISFHSMKAWIADYTPYNRMLGVMLAGEYELISNKTTDDTFYIAYNMHGLSHTFDLPNLKKGYEWNLLISTSDNKDNSYNLELSKQTNKCHSVTIEAFSILILIGKEEKNT